MSLVCRSSPSPAARLAFASSALVVVLGACDNRQAFREPDPSLARMLEQRRADPYAPSAFFADGKTMRNPPREALAQDDDEARDPAPPSLPRSRALLVMGRERFEIVCAACHGIAGDGVSVVATKMRRRPPPSLHEARLRELPAERLYRIASEGYGLMPGYADLLTSDERWAVVAYVQALQLSQHAPMRALPADVRAELAKAAP